MPTYQCPSCKNHVHDVRVYKKEPDEVKCPFCGHTFNPKDPKNGSPGA